MFAAFKGEKWEVLRIVPLMAALFVQEYVPEQIAEFAGISSTKSVVALKLGSAIILVLVLAIADYLLRTRAGQAIRRHSEQKAFEGVWAQSVTIPARPYSIALIGFDAKAGRWTYAGVAFKSDFRPGAEWHTVDLSLQPSEGKRVWFFAGSANLRKYDAQLGATKPEGGSGVVVPLLRLPANPNGPIEGRVADIDVNGVSQIFDVILKRVPAALSSRFNTKDDILSLKEDEVKNILCRSQIRVDADVVLSH